MKVKNEYNEMDIKIPSDFKSGNDNVDEISAMYKLSPKRDLAMIVLHGFTMAKDDLYRYGNFLNSNGISTFHIDLPYHGRRGINGNGYEGFEIKKSVIRNGFYQSVSDVKRSISLLESIGHKNISIGGYSLGGILSLLMMGIDKRLKKGVAICAGGDIAEIIMNSKISRQIAEGLRKDGEDYESLRESLKEFEPCDYARRINPENLLMINGEFDEIVPKRNVEKFISSMTSKPNINWQECDHFSPDFVELSLNYLQGGIS